MNEESLISVKTKEIYFSCQDWTGQIRMNSLMKWAFARSRFLACWCGKFIDPAAMLLRFARRVAIAC
jgi:hypothetical protein